MKWAFITLALWHAAVIAQDPDEPPNIEDIEDLIIDPPVEPTTLPPPKEEEKICHTDLSGPSGRLATENFPEKYASKSNCTWNITVEEGKRIRLTFHLFHVEHNNFCNWDWVKVYDSNDTLLHHLCGFLEQDKVIFSSSNTISLRFYSDGVVEQAGFLASWLAVDPETVEAEEEKSSAGYLLSFPQSFALSDEASEEKLCLQMNNLEEDGEVKVSVYSAAEILAGEPAVHTTLMHTAGDESVNCFSMPRLPKTFEGRTGVLGIEADFPNSKYNILSFKSVRILRFEPLVLIQTDKPEYRPKQTVKFRVFLMNAELKPASVQKVDEIYIVNPKDSRIAQWRDVAVDQGIAQLEMPLSEEPVLGAWTIKMKISNETTEQAAKFVVAENVLPKFEVVITPPPFILKEDPEVTFQVCGKYTHGGNVKGNINATFHTEFKGPYWRAPTIRLNHSVLLNDTEGCADVVLTNEELSRLTAQTSELKLIAIVEEKGTGTTFNATWEMTEENPIQNSPLKIEFAGSPNEHIIGGFPYVGKIQVREHDDDPVAGAKLKVCARLFEDIEELRRYMTSNSHKLYSFNEDNFLGLAEKINKLKSEETCNTYTTDDSGVVHFAVPLFNVSADVTKLSVLVTAVDYEANKTTGMVQPLGKLDVGLTHSKASAALTIYEEEAPMLDCGENELTIFFAAPADSTVDLTYYFSSGGYILRHGSSSIQVGSEDLVDEFVGEAETIKIGETDVKVRDQVVSKHKISITRPFEDETKVSSTFKLLVYTRDESGETLTATREYKAAYCLEKPKIKWSEEQTKPGKPVKLTVEGTAEGICGYSVIDKSVSLVPNANRVTQPKLQELKEDLAKRRIVTDEVRKSCQNADLMYEAFKKLGLFLMTDNLIENFKCDSIVDVTLVRNNDGEEPPIPVPVALEANFAQEESADFAFDAPQAAPQTFAAGPPEAVSSFSGGGPQFSKVSANRFAGGRPTSTSASENIEVPEVELRNYFPETWLFNLVQMGDADAVNIDLDAPHTITTWIAEAACTNPATGLGVAEPANLLVTQEFFADLVLPYSVKRGEVLPINVSVFNNIEGGLPMRLTLLPSDDYKIVEESMGVCVGAESNEIKTFNIKAKELHEVNVTVEAKIDNGIGVDGCEAAEKVQGFADTVQRPIQVKPEGFPVEKVQSHFQCIEDGEKAEVEFEDLALPGNLVEGSERAWATITGDIMAPALANLDKVVQLPTGCGEQNMITLVPNIYLMEYLRGTDKSEPELEEKAKEYMRIGYEREQKFRHGDGAYSIWGKQDKDGSMWLTSFVVKAFSQASKFIDIDLKNVQESVDWIVANQQENGCFPNRGYVYHHDLKDSDQSLTAHVLLTLLEAKSNINAKINPDVVGEAVKCIIANTTEETEVYTRSLVTYAMTLLFHSKDDTVVSDVTLSEQAEKMLEEIMALVNTTSPGHLFWTDGTNSRSKAVEITAYNILTMVLQDKMPEALKAVKWLATQRNSVGGFVSTQDTVVAMQALSQYALKTNVKVNDVVVEVSEAKGDKHKFMVSNDNKLLLQEKRLNELPNKLSVAVDGKGCFMVQTVLRYNIKDTPTKNSFEISAELEKESLDICATYTGAKKTTNMVVIEVEMLSGYAADLDSLERYKNEVDSMLRKVETDKEANSVILYFDSIPKELKCFEIEVKQEVVVDELKPAIVKIYDYYDQEDVASVEYTKE